MLEWPIFTHLKFTWCCNVPCQMAYFLPLHPSLSIEPGHFLKIYGKILPCSRLSDTMRFSTLLDYWRIVADPFLSDIHCMTRFFTHALPPPRSGLFSLCLTYQIFLNSPLGRGAWGWGWGWGVGRGDPSPYTCSTSTLLP